jgi:hypothetical protein
MTKKNRERFFERVRADAERFCPDLDSASKSDITELLSAAGTDVDSLRMRLNESARKLALTQRLKGTKVPAYLQDVIDLTGRPEEPAKNPKIAVEKAIKWLDGFVNKVVPTPREITVQRAYRKAGDLSRKDASVLNKLEEKLKDQVKKEHE